MELGHFNKYFTKKTKKMALQGNIIDIFCQILLTYILNAKFNPKMDTIRPSHLGINLLPSLKLVRSMLQTLNLVRKYKYLCSFRKYSFQFQDPINLADISIFLENIIIFGKNTFTQSNNMRVISEIFKSCFQFLKDRKLLLMKT